MSILLFILFGFIVGLLARAIMPGRQHLGLIMTSLLGMIGSFVGGLIGALISGRSVAHVTPAGLLGSIIGALIVLFVMAPLSRRVRI